MIRRHLITIATAVAGITAIATQNTHTGMDAVLTAALTAVAAVTIAAEEMGRAALRIEDDPITHVTADAGKPSVPALQHQGEGR